MKLKIFVVLISIFLIYYNLPGKLNEPKLKRSQYRELIEDLRLREKSLMMEKKFLQNYIQEFPSLDSLLYELEKCRNSLEIEKEKDTLGIKLNKVRETNRLFRL